MSSKSVALARFPDFRFDLLETELMSPWHGNLFIDRQTLWTKVWAYKPNKLEFGYHPDYVFVGLHDYIGTFLVLFDCWRCFLSQDLIFLHTTHTNWLKEGF